MNRLSNLSLSELEVVMPCFENEVLRDVIGGGTGTYADPFTFAEMDAMVYAGTWEGGFVEGLGMLGGTITYTGTYTGGNSNGGPLANPIIQSIVGGIASLVSSTLGKVFTAASVFDNVRDFYTGNIKREILAHRLIWTGIGFFEGGPIGAAGAGIISYATEVAAEYAAEKINELEYRLNEFFSNPLNLSQGLPWW